MKRVEMPLLLLACLSLLPYAAQAGGETPPDDEFLEYLGAWDEAWEQACEPDGYLPGDAACEQTDDEQDDEN